MQSKSHIIEFPTFLDDELTRHFIRGYFDGDGSIFSENYSTDAKDFKMNFTGNLQFISGLHSYLSQFLNSKTTVRPNNESFQAVYGSYDDMTFLYNYFYKNSDSTLRLVRKYNKFPSNEDLKISKENRRGRIASDFEELQYTGPEKLTVQDTRENIILGFKNSVEASKVIGLPESSIRIAANKNRLVHGRYIVRRR